MKPHLIGLVLFISLRCFANDIGYDPTADPFKQLQDAAAQAKQSDKYILIISGGEWCKWCYVLDDYLRKNDKIHNRLKRNFVIVKVYFGEKNMNESFFAQLPESGVAPHFWVLNADREILLSQYTNAFKKDKNTYSDKAFDRFNTIIEQHKTNVMTP